ncbi:MAG: alpha/beta hydrolase-fold protein [Acidobacteriota bacterium]
MRPTPTPIPQSRLDAASAPSSCAVVLLPGVFDRPGDFVRRGFIDAATARVPEVALVAPDAHLGYYRKRSILVRLRADVVTPLRAAHEQVWLTGISLGGVGSLLYAREHGDDIAGIFLLAPFLGEDDLIEEIRAAGGVLAWSPKGPPGDDDFAIENWLWLQRWHGSPVQDRPQIWLGYGAADDFAPAAELLAELLAPERILIHPGGHDWDAWTPLWRDFLAAGALDACRASG